jgi:hypothetical protein
VKEALVSYEQNSVHCSATPSSDKCVKQVPDGEGGGGGYEQKSVHFCATPSSDKFGKWGFPMVKAALASYEENSVHCAATATPSSDKFVNCMF